MKTAGALQKAPGLKSGDFSSVEILINIKTFSHTRITKYDKVYGYMI